MQKLLIVLTLLLSAAAYPVGLIRPGKFNDGFSADFDWIRFEK